MKLRSSPARPAAVAGPGLLLIALLLLAAAAGPRSAAAAEDDRPRTNPDPTAAIGAGGRRRILKSGSGNIFDRPSSANKSHKGKKRAKEKKKKKKKKKKKVTPVHVAEDDGVYVVRDIQVSNEKWTVFTDESKAESEEIKIKQLWTSSKPGQPMRMTAFWEDGDDKMYSLTFVDGKLTIFSPNDNIEVEFANVAPVSLQTDGETGEVYTTVQQKDPIEVKSVELNGQNGTPRCESSKSFLIQLSVVQYLIGLYTSCMTIHMREAEEIWCNTFIKGYIEEHGILRAFVQWTECFESTKAMSIDPEQQEITMHPSSKEVDEQMLNAIIVAF